MVWHGHVNEVPLSFGEITKYGYGSIEGMLPQNKTLSEF